MTNRERILTALHHEMPDRTPAYGRFHPVVIERLKTYYTTTCWEDVLEELGINGFEELSTTLKIPQYERRVTERPGGKKGPRKVWLDERTFEEPWGYVYRYGENDWYTQWMRGPLQDAETIEDILNYGFPQSEHISEPEEYAEKVKRLKAKDKFVYGVIENPYKTAWLLRGMENVLMDYKLNRPLLEGLYEKLYELYTEMAVKMVQAGVDCIKVIGDIAMQERVIMGPEAWRTVDKPGMAKLISDCRSVNPGLHFFFHSDGNMLDVMDDLIEIGYDIINPIQPECMDPFEVKKRWGDKITLDGCISLQRTLPFGTCDEVAAEMKALIQGCGYNGGFIMASSNVIQPDTPLENISTCFHTARDYKL